MRVSRVFCLVPAFCLACSGAWAAQDLACHLTSTPPVIDGVDDDPAWQAAHPLVTRDAVAGIDHSVRCVHTAQQVFIAVSFPDADENREHKTLVWNAAEKRYSIAAPREDTLVLKWNMEPLETDISLSSDENYRADIWYWKSVRTDHAGYADDKLQTYSDQPLPDGKRMVSKDGRRFYLKRQGDDGRSSYKAHSPAGYAGDRRSGYELRQPAGSRADVRARGQWSDGWWTVEFARKLETGNADDVQLVGKRRYQFGVSRYEIAGRRPDPGIEVPLFGSGEIGEDLYLILSGSQTALQ